MSCEKCKELRGHFVPKYIKSEYPVVSLGRGELYMTRMREEIKAASAIWGFPCIYYIGCRSESMEYQFIQYCPLCGEKLV